MAIYVGQGGRTSLRALPTRPCQCPSVDPGLFVGVVAGLCLFWLVLLIILWALRPKDVSARELMGTMPDVLRLLRSLISDRSTAPDVRIVLVLLMVWILSPIDLIPEFIPVLGPLDDVVVTIVAIRYVRRRLGSEELRRRWQGTPDGFALLSRVIGTT